MAENMMNSYFKSTNDKARTNWDKAFKVLRRDGKKEEIGDWLDENPGVLEYIYEAINDINSIFGEKSRLILDTNYVYDAVGIEIKEIHLTCWIQLVIHSEIGINDYIDKLSIFASKWNKYNDWGFEWNLEFIEVSK